MTPIRVHLRHIQDEVRYLVQESSWTTKSQFDRNETTKREFVRNIEIIGEAAKKVPADLKQRHPQVDLRGMTGMRDRLIHYYFGVDYDIVWNVAATKAAQLEQDVETILRDEAPAE